MRSKISARSRSHRRGTVVRRKALLGIVASRVCKLSLHRLRRNMSVTSRGLFFGIGARVNPAAAAVEAHAVPVLVHPRVVHVVDDVTVDAIHRRVVEKMPVLPATAFISVTEVS